MVSSQTKSGSVFQLHGGTRHLKPYGCFQLAWTMKYQSREASLLSVYIDKDSDEVRVMKSRGWGGGVPVPGPLNLSTQLKMERTNRCTIILWWLNKHGISTVGCCIPYKFDLRATKEDQSTAHCCLTHCIQMLQLGPDSYRVGIGQKKQLIISYWHGTKDNPYHAPLQQRQLEQAACLSVAVILERQVDVMNNQFSISFANYCFAKKRVSTSCDSYTHSASGLQFSNNGLFKRTQLRYICVCLWILMDFWKSKICCKFQYAERPGVLMLLSVLIIKCL